MAEQKHQLETEFRLLNKNDATTKYCFLLEFLKLKAPHCSRYTQISRLQCPAFPLKRLPPMKSKLITLSVLLLFSANTFAQDTRLTDYVDPRIGSEGLGRVFIGPAPTEW